MPQIKMKNLKVYFSLGDLFDLSDLFDPGEELRLNLTSTFS